MAQNKNYHPNAVAGGNSAKNQQFFKNNPQYADQAKANSSEWWNANDAYKKAEVAGDSVGMLTAKNNMDKAHKAQNDYYESLGLGDNSNPGLFTKFKQQPQATLRGTNELAKLYGLTVDEQVILKKYQDLVDKQFALKRKEYAQAEDAWYTNMATVSADNVAALRKVYDNAIANGASSGLVAASVLGEQLGLTQDTIQSATDLANQRYNLADKEAEARAQAALDAFKDSQAVKQALGTLGANIYASDVQDVIGRLDYEAQMDANQVARDNQWLESLANALLSRDQIASNERMNKEDNETQRYGFDKNLEGTIYSANKNYEGTVYNANKNYAGTVYSADKNYAAALLKTLDSTNPDGTPKTVKDYWNDGYAAFNEKDLNAYEPIATAIAEARGVSTDTIYREWSEERAKLVFSDPDNIKDLTDSKGVWRDLLLEGKNEAANDLINSLALGHGIHEAVFRQHFMDDIETPVKKED